MPASLQIDPEANPAERTSLEAIEVAARQHPSFLERTITLYGQAPEVVGELLDFIQADPEGLGTLMAWRHVVREALDGLVEFDPETEEAIAKDRLFVSLKADFDKTQGNEVLRNKLRARRWHIFGERAA